MEKRVLVTGGNGVLGRELVPRLQQAGYRLRITSRKERPAGDNDLEWRVASLQQADGWLEALSGVDTVVHAASDPFREGIDPQGTRHLLSAAAQAGVSHIVYISIVGVDKKDWYYYADKLLCEQLIAQSGIGFSILRTTQFHDFIHRFLSELFLRFPIGFLPHHWRFQTIDTGEVADLLCEAVARGPAGRLPDAGGPEILTFREMADVWMEAKGRRLVLPLPAPLTLGKLGEMGRPFTLGHNLAPDRRVGKRTWQQWVQQTLT